VLVNRLTGALLVLGLILCLAAGCGGSDEKTTSTQAQTATTTPATTGPTGSQGTTGDQTQTGAHSGRSEQGNLPGTYTWSGSTKGVLKEPDSLSDQVAFVDRVKNAPKNKAGGCRLYVVGKQRQWGPPPPGISARLAAADEVIVRWRFKKFPKSLGCKPARVVIGISQGKPGKKGFTSIVFKYKVRSLNGESTQRTQPYLTKPPYKVTVAGESYDSVQGPPVSVRVNR
jgi:hypothetical protein